MLTRQDRDLTGEPIRNYFAYGVPVSLFGLCLFYLQQKLQKAAVSGEDVPGDESVSGAPTSGEIKYVDDSERLSIGKRYSIARLFCCVSLFGLQSYNEIKSPLAYLAWSPQRSEMICYIYALALAAFTLKKIGPKQKFLLLQIDFLLCFIFFVYAYQDIWPLATFTLRPRDTLSVLLFSKIALLFTGGAILPLTTPYLGKFCTGDGKIQGLSVWSRLTYSYLDPLIYRAKPDLLQDFIPPLASKNKSEYLMRRVQCILEPHSLVKRHLFWHLFREFRKEFLELSFLQLSHTVLFLSGPIGINRLLRYLEGKDSLNLRPWVWICVLFLGPSSRSILLQLYNNVSNQVMVQLEAILARTLFDYTLRSQSDPSRNKTEGTNQIGKINNLATSDIANIAAGVEAVIIAIYSPVMVALSIWFLYSILEWSAILGFVAMLLLLPLPAHFTTKMRELQQDRSKKTDARVQKIVEVMSKSRTIKLLGWGPRAKVQIDQLRNEELGLLKKYKLVEIFTANLNFLIPLVAMLVTYSAYTIVFHGELTSSRVFASMAIFESLRLHIRFTLNTIPTIVQARVSLDRFDSFMRNSEPVDSDGSKEEKTHLQNTVGFRDTHFTWSPTDLSSFHLKIDGEVIFKFGLTLVTGPTASGKSSLLMALLGEMHSISTTKVAWVSLPRQYGIAYAAQDSWIQSGTVKENILFDAPYDENRYQQVIFQCGLRQDLVLFPNGDMTRIGERGLTLSGGQKARITMARAVYSSAKVLLFDDTFAALDVHTTNWIARYCFSGELMHGRIVLLVTHNVELLKPIATAIVTLGSDGTCHYRERKSDEINLLDSSRYENDGGAPDTLEFGTMQDAVVQNTSAERAEEIHEDHVKREAFGLYIGNMSRHPILLCIAVVFLLSGNEGGLVMQAWWMGFWANQYEKHASSDISGSFYILVLICMVTLSVSLHTSTSMLFAFGSLRASKIVHSLLFDSVLGSCWRWLDITPSARVIVRATQDMRTIDGPVPFNIRRVMELNLSMLIKLGAILIFSPLYIFPAVLITCMGLLNGQFYMRAQLPVRRMMSNAKSPIIAHFSATIDGLVSIRAYGAQKRYAKECTKRIDAYTQVAMTYWTMNRWVSVRSDILGAIFTAGLSLYLVYGSNRTSASNTGFSLTVAVGFSSSILTWVRMVNNLELNANSLERIYDYTTIEQERKLSDIHLPAYWPSKGELRAVNLSARYSQDGEEVLKDLSFEVKSGERIGIVGRTGAGKSSLVLALLQCLITEGEVFYDGIPTSKLDVVTLRSKFTVIPQIPDLFPGTLRDNLDPFHDFDDADLYAALRSIGLRLLQLDGCSQSSVLDTQIVGRGDNFSVGQRQIIALARALLQGHKILILDEATSAIDYQTDAAIQDVLRHQLQGVTILTIAHRLRTIMDFDRIIVLSEGHIVEFDKPRALLEREGSCLKSMVDGSADKDELYALAMK